MSKPFDASAKDLLEADPESWIAYLHLKHQGPVRVIDSDLSSVTAEADKVLRIDDPEPWLVHVELQASHDLRLAHRMLRYNVLLNYRHGLPVLSAAVLLRRSTDIPELSGGLEQRLTDGQSYLSFRYRVVRAWEQPVESILQGGLGTLPLAPLADVTIDDLPNVLSRMGERFRAEASPSESATLWSATELLLGLRYPPDVADQILQGVHHMIFGIHGIEESSTYQAILAKGRAEGEARGRAEEAKRILMIQGQKRFGLPPEPITTAIEALDLEQFERLVERLDEVSTWEELLADL